VTGRGRYTGPVDGTSPNRVEASRADSIRDVILNRPGEVNRVIDIGDLIHPEPTPPRILAIREEDHLVFDVSWSGLEQKTEGGEPVLSRSQKGHGFLILIFAPQNLAEKAYYQKFSDDPNKKDKEFDTTTEGQPSKTVDVKAGEEPPETPPIDALLSDDSRLVFKVPKGTIIPLSITGVLEAAGRLELSVPANAQPRERRLDLFVVPSDAILAGEVSARGKQSLVERLVTSGRLREKVQSTAAVLVEADSRLIGVVDANRMVTVTTQPRGNLGGQVANDAHVSIRDHLDTIAAIRPTPALPAFTQTAIESPYRLIISPSVLGGWAHAVDSVEHGGRTELWHTRLGVRVTEDGEIEVNEVSPFQRVVRAVWTPYLAKSDSPPDSDSESPSPFRMSLDDRDRHNIVHLSSNFGITHNRKRYVPEPVTVNRLMLTSLGSWMDFAGRWVPEPKGLSMEEWIHRATLGRDHYVRVVYQGFLGFPGNRSTLVKITERMFASDVPEKNWGQSGNPAYLTQRMFLVIREEEKTFPVTGHKFEGSKRFSNAMPLKSVRILDRQTPDIDPPSDPRCFIPKIATKPFLFSLVVTDVEGNQHSVKAPLVFVDKSLDDFPDQLGPKLDAVYNSKQEATIGFGGQRVAFAPAKGLDDTTFETTTISFEATVPDGVAKATPGPHFLPRIVSAKVAVPAIRQLARGPENLSVSYHSTFLEHGFAANSPNKGEVLFTVAPTDFDLKEKADKTGGLASPSMVISGISRLTGPVAGNLDTIKQGKFDPADFFAGSLEPHLFGVIPLSKVIKEVASIADDLPRIPRFVGNVMDGVEGFLDDLARIEQLVKSEAALWAGVKTEIGAVLDAIEQKLGGASPDLSAALGQLHNALGDLESSLPGDLGLGVANQAKTVVARAKGAVAGVNALVDDLVKGIELARTANARFEWRPGVKAWPENAPIFAPTKDNLVLYAETRGATQGEDAEFTVGAAIEDFKLNLIGDNTFVVLDFTRIRIQAQAGSKPEIDVEIAGVTFTGVLAFVETLKDLIPLDGFSDPPAVMVDTTGIRADLSVGLPNLSVGVFSLENLSLGAGFVVPFVGDPLSVYFRFCERENPALVSVSLFAGGFYFGITINPGGVQVLEAAIEFGANVSMDFGVASGGVSAMAGIYFKLENDDALLAGYFRVRGHVRALGIVTVSIELYLEFSYEFPTNKAVGRASLSISIEIFMFETTITISCEKKFSGAGKDPTFAQAMGVYQLDPSDPTSPVVDPWKEYCVAFA
jgi:hypothetical protein